MEMVRLQIITRPLESLKAAGTIPSTQMMRTGTGGHWVITIGTASSTCAIVEGSKDNDFTKRDKLFKGLGNGTFTMVANSAGFDLNVHTGGSGQWVDFNNDGKLDLFVKNWTTSPNELFRNNGDGTFTDVAATAGLADVRGSNSAWADYDNDGYMDVMITGLGGLIPEPPDALFHNNRNGTFTEVTASAGLPVRNTGRGIAWGDYNNDGNIDVYIARGEAGPIPPDGSTKTSLYRNNGNGTFTEVTDQAGRRDNREYLGRHLGRLRQRRKPRFVRHQ